MNIYVGNLPFSITEEKLKETFSEFGEVTSVKIITDRESGKSKGFGFVEMANEKDAKNAIEQADGKEIDGRNLRVNLAKRKKNDDDSNNNNYKKRQN